MPSQLSILKLLIVTLITFNILGLCLNIAVLLLRLILYYATLLGILYLEKKIKRDENH